MIRINLFWARAYPPVTRANTPCGQKGDFNLHLMPHGYLFLHVPKPLRRNRGAVRASSIHSHSFVFGIWVVGQLSPSTSSVCLFSSSWAHLWIGMGYGLRNPKLTPSLSCRRRPTWSNYVFSCAQRVIFASVFDVQHTSGTTY